MLGSLYVIMSLGCNDNKKICKIGSTKNVKNRIMVYKTCFPDTDNITCHIIELKQSKYDCYQLDESIKKLSAKYAIPYPHYNGTGGEEFYLLDDMSADAVRQDKKNSFAGLSGKPLCDYLDVLNVKYSITSCNMNEIFSSYDKLDFGELHKEQIQKNKIKENCNFNIEIKKIIVGKLIVDDTLVLRDYQKDCITRAKELYDRNGKITGIIYAPPGSGKTIIGIMLANYILEKNPNGYIIWITKFRNVLDQQFTVENEILWKKSTILMDEVEIIRRPGLSGSVGFYGFFSKEALQESAEQESAEREMKERPDLSSKKAQVLCTNSMTIITCCSKLLKMRTEQLVKENLLGIIYDECHNLGDKLYECLKKISGVKNNKLMVGMSATPRVDDRYRELFSLWATVPDFLLDYSFINAIADGYIVPINIKYCYIERQEQQNKEGDEIHHPHMNNTFDSIVNPTKCYTFIKKILNKSFNGKCILWANTCESASQWFKFLRPKLKADGYSSHLNNSKEPGDTFVEFVAESKKSVMVAVDRFKEGTDVPNISVVGFLDPVQERSMVMMLQSMGRGVRRHGNKKCCEFFEFIFQSNKDIISKKMGEYFSSIVYNVDAKKNFNSGGGVILKNKKNRLAVYSNGKLINTIKITGNFDTFDYMGLTAKMYNIIASKLDNIPTWKEVKAILAENNIKDDNDAINFFKGDKNNLNEWWEIMKYRFIDWNDLLSYDVSKYYSVEECKQKIKEYIADLYKKIKFKEIKNMTGVEIYKKYILKKDKKLPIDVVSYCNVSGYRELLNINIFEFS